MENNISVISALGPGVAVSRLLKLAGQTASLNPWAPGSLRNAVSKIRLMGTEEDK